MTSGFLVAPTVNASYVYTDRTNVSTGWMDSAIDHLHAFGAWSGGVNTNHYHNVAGNTGGGSADNVYEARPYSATVLSCINIRCRMSIVEETSKVTQTAISALNSVPVLLALVLLHSSSSAASCG